MPRIRLFVEVELKAGVSVVLDKKQAHYLCTVMRSKVGADILLFNGVQGEWVGCVVEISKKSCVVKVLRQERKQVDEPDLWLCFALVKNIPMHNIVQKATELGVGILQPMVTKHTVVSRVNIARLYANAIEAAEQSNRLSVPEVLEPVSIVDLLDEWDDDRQIILCDESGSGEPFGDAIRSITSNKVAIMIGPEGGFAQTEFEIMRNKSYIVFAGLGPRILRSDTAVIASMSCYMSVFGDWGVQPRFDAGV